MSDHVSGIQMEVCTVLSICTAQYTPSHLILTHGLAKEGLLNTEARIHVRYLLRIVGTPLARPVLGIVTHAIVDAPEDHLDVCLRRRDVLQ